MASAAARPASPPTTAPTTPPTTMPAGPPTVPAAAPAMAPPIAPTPVPNGCEPDSSVIGSRWRSLSSAMSCAPWACWVAMNPHHRRAVLPGSQRSGRVPVGKAPAAFRGRGTPARTVDSCAVLQPGSGRGRNLVARKRRKTRMKYALRKTPSHLHVAYKYGEGTDGLMGRNFVLEVQDSLLTLSIDL